MDSSGCIRVQDTFSQNPASVAGSSDSCPGRTADGANEGGHSVSNFQGCHLSDESLPTTVPFNTLSSGERTRDGGVPPCDQSKGTKQISTKGEVQNGGAPYYSLSSTQGRLYDETRPEGRLLCSPDTPGVKEISSFPVQGNNLRVLLPPIRPLLGSPSLHQNPPADCRQTALRGNTNSHLLGRSSPDSPSEGHIERDLPLCAKTFVQPGFHSETREMLSGTNSSLSLSRCSARHNLHVSCPSRGTDQSDPESMPRNARVSVKIPGWTVEPLGPHEPCRTDGPVIAPLYYRALQRQQALLLHQPSLEDLRWWVSSTPHDRNSQDISPPPFDLTIRTDASLQGWGATCNGTSTGGRWSVEEAAHQLFGTQGSHSSFEGISASRHTATTPESGLPSPTSYPSGHTTAVVYVNRRGGTQSPSLSLLA